MSHDLKAIVQPILKRLGIEDVKSRTNSISFLYKNLKYTMKIDDDGERIDVSRGDKKSFLMVHEIPLINHFLMPFVELEIVDQDPFMTALNFFDPYDIMLRLHLIMDGDFYVQKELIMYIGAGAQYTLNMFVARKK